MLLTKFQLTSRPFDRDFLIFGEEVWSFGRFCDEVRRATEWLAAEGVGAGTVLAVCGPYSPRALAVFFAAADLKAILVPMTEMNEAERDRRFRAAGVEAVIEKLEVRSENEEGDRRDEGTFEVQRAEDRGYRLSVIGSQGRFKVEDARERFKARGSKFDVDGKKRSEPSTEDSTSSGNTEDAGVDGPGGPGYQARSESRRAIRSAGHSARHPLIRQLVRAGRSGLILFSSGTTGEPKAMLHDLGRLVEGYSIKEGPGPRTLAFLHYDHIGGLDILFRALASGASLVIPEDRDPGTIARLIERHRIEVLPASPTFLNLFLLSGVAEKYDLSALRIVGYGSEPMPEPLLNRLQDTFPEVRFQQKFGTSETSAIRIVGRSPGSLEMKVEDSRVEWKAVDGELWIRSPARIVGYLNVESDSLSADGWYRTGDLVEETGDGFFRIVGRRSDLINVGGEKVFPSEVESVLMELPEIRECRVFGEENALTGQVVAVEVVASEDFSAMELKRRIRAFCRNRLEPHKTPVKVYRVEGIQLGGSFKKRRGGE